jgi:hypothetical protein
MQRWKCTVKTPSGFIRTIHVEANDYSDATLQAENMTGGDCTMVHPDNDLSNKKNETSSQTSSGGFILLLILGVFIFHFWQWALLIGGIALIAIAVIKSAE